MNPIYEAHREAFAELLDPRFYTPGWLDGEVWTGAIRVFGNAKACVLVRLKPYPTGAWEIHGEAAVGELESILELIEDAEAWGRKIGCITASIASRPGWQRVLKGKGWEPFQVELRKDLA